MDFVDDNQTIIDAGCEIGHGAVSFKLHTMFRQPMAQRLNEGIILVIDSALDAAQRFDASKFHHKTMQIALKFDRAVPRLKGKGGGPHKPKVGLKKTR